MSKYKLLLILAGFMMTLTACSSATITQRRFEPRKMGIVRFEDGLFAFLGGEKGRSLAEKEMSDFCAPKSYKVIEESDREVMVKKTSKTNNNSGSESTERQSVDKKQTFAKFYCN